MPPTPFPGTALRPLLIAVLALVAYLPALTQPFIEDDYPIISLSRSYGPLNGWGKMAHDEVNRVRASTFILTHWIERFAGLKPVWFYATSLLLHIINCWLIYALGRWSLVGYRVSFWAASFFAIYEGHQEAVMWYAAANELLLFFFGLLCLLAWLTFLERGERRWLAVSIVTFLLALLSKESAVVLTPLLLLLAVSGKFERKQSLMVGLFLIVSVIYVLLILQTRHSSFRFHDQSFVLSAPFWETWTKSYFGLLVPWGWLAILVLVLRRMQITLALSMGWIAISFVPYMFVDYVHSIPSRQTYLASLGLALLVGAAISCLTESPGSRRSLAVAVVLVLIVVHNVAYLRFVKHKQFLLRAEPTEELISFSHTVAGPIYVRCFPRPPIIANAAVEIMANKPPGTLIWDEVQARALGVTQTFCFER